jgi:hypothetical protein
LDNDQTQEEEARKIQLSYLLGKYRPAAGRADRLAGNTPGGFTSMAGANADHMIGHGGSN